MDSPSPAWKPEADNTAAVKLPDSLDPVIEQLAEKVHNRWAERRIEEGWTFGPERNDKLRTTPNLVAYDELPEIEKNYDRATALTTLKALYGAGYRVVSATPADTGDGEARLVEDFLADVDSLRFEAADLLWRSHTVAFWKHHPDLLHRLARRASDAGWPLLAYDMASKTLAARDADADIPPREIDSQLHYLAALSLMEVGALERASQELGKIEERGKILGDVQGLRGRLAKVRGLRAKDADDAAGLFLTARDTYLAPYRTAREKFLREGNADDGNTAYYLGINAASMSAWAGHREEAVTAAAEVLEICDRLSAASSVGTPDPWLEATRGEAHLLRHDGQAAALAYRAAAGALGNRWRSLQSMRRQALETARRTTFPVDEVEKWFNPPKLSVFGFSGRRQELPTEKSVVFFFLREPEQLDLAAEIIPRCSEFHLGLEQPPDRFEARLTPRQAALFKRIQAATPRLLGREEQQMIGEDVSPCFVKMLFRGAVLLRSKELDLHPAGLPTLEECGCGPGDLAASPVRALLCADVKGFSRLDAGLLRVFVSEYLGVVGRVVAGFLDSAITVKTAGDGLFMAFRDLPASVRFALELRDAITAFDWAARGMPEDMGLRISLDAGPMMEFKDPVTGNIDVAGRLVNRAARIEPITPVNHVYASRTLAALAMALEIPGVRFEYAGETPLPKGFGAFQLYHLTNA